jgi:hypothetical protein
VWIGGGSGLPMATAVVAMLVPKAAAVAATQQRLCLWQLRSRVASVLVAAALDVDCREQHGELSVGMQD